MTSTNVNHKSALMYVLGANFLVLMLSNTLQETRINGNSNLPYHKAQPNKFSIVMPKLYSLKIILKFFPIV